MAGSGPKTASLGRKVVVLLLAILVLAGVFQTLALGIALTGWFDELEDRETADAAERLAAAVEAERSSLASLALDYAAWDDARSYVEGRNAGFADENFLPRWAATTELALVMVLSQDAAILWKGETSNGAFSKAAPARGGERFAPLAGAPTSGPWFDVAEAEGGPLLVCAQPVTDSEYAASPSGWILFARRLDERMSTRISERSGLLAMIVGGRGPAGEGARGTSVAGTLGAAYRDEGSIRRLRLPLRDAAGADAAWIEAGMERTLLEPERRLLWRIGAYLAATAVVAILTLVAALRGLALRPLAAMAARLNELAEWPAPGARIGMGTPRGRRDEIGTVSDRIDALLGTLETERILLERANEELERMAQIDFLTGLPNRRRLEDYADREVRRISRELRGNDKKGFIAVLIADIDHFKLYNDLYGHLKGDECLKSVAEAIDGAVHRPADLPCRFGGEEFLVLLPETDLEGALRVAENLMTAIHAIALPFPDSPVRPIVTLSIGAAAGPVAAGFELKSIVRDADEAMYAAKRSGRDAIRSVGDSS